MSETNGQACVVASVRRDGLPPAATVLGDAQGTAWGSVPKTDLARSLKPPIGDLTLLYLSEKDYGRAIAKLSPEDTQEAVRQRRNIRAAVLPAMVDDVGSRFGRLGAVADGLAHSAGDSRKAASWGQISAAAMKAYESCYETGRIIQCDKEHASMIIQWRATIATIENALASRPNIPAGAKAAVDAAVAAYDATFNDLAALAKELGEPAYTQAPARDSQERMIFVPRGHPMVQTRIASRDVQVTDWSGGWLAPLGPAEVDHAVKTQGIMMYWSAGEYSLASRQLTRAQLDRDLRERLQNRGPTIAQSLAVIVEMRLSLIAHLNGIIDRSPGKLSEQGMASAESARLRELRQLPRFVAAQEADSQLDIDWVRKSTAGAGADLLVLKPFCDAAQDASLIQWIDGAEVSLRRMHQILSQGGL